MDQSRRQLYIQRAEKYLQLFAGIAKNSDEESFAKNIALQRVIDEKLKQLIEDPRRDNTIAIEIKKTAKELAEVNSDIAFKIKQAFDNTKPQANLFAEYQEKIKQQDFIAAQEILVVLKQRKNRALYELLIKIANEDQAHKDYSLSRVGKTIAASYVLTQIIIMLFLGVLVLSAFGTAPWLLGIVIPIMILGPIFTGISNWWLFRGLTSKTLIGLRNMLLIDTDLTLTSIQKNKLRFLSFFCIVCGFMASYAFYVLLIEMTPALLTLLNISGLAVIAAAFPWFIPLVMICVVLPIFIKGAIAVAAYFFRSLYEPIIRNHLSHDLCEFYAVMTEYDKTNIENKLAQLRLDARTHYGRYYKGKALEDKIKEVVDESIIGVILIKKLERLEDGKDIKNHARLTFFLMCFLIPGMIGGIIATQLLSYANLTSALHWTYAAAEALSWLICGIAGITYINVIISGGAKCVVDLAYSVIKTEGHKKTNYEKAKFQCVRGWNSTMNFFEAVAGYVLKKAESIKDFAAETYAVVKSGFDISVGTYLTTTAGCASFLTNSIQGNPTTYEEDWEYSQQEYKTAESCLNAWRTVDIDIEKAEEQLKPLLTQWPKKLDVDREKARLQQATLYSISGTITSLVWRAFGW